MTLGHVNSRSGGDRRGSKCVSIFAFWQVEHNETIRIGLIRFCKNFWTKKNARDIMQPKMTWAKITDPTWISTKKSELKYDYEVLSRILTKLKRHRHRAARKTAGAPSFFLKTTLIIAQWPGLAHSRCARSQNMWNRVRSTYPKRPSRGASRLLATSENVDQMLANAQCLEVRLVNMFRFTLSNVLSIHGCNGLSLFIS